MFIITETGHGACGKLNSRHKDKDKIIMQRERESMISAKILGLMVPLMNACKCKLESNGKTERVARSAFTVQNLSGQVFHNFI